MENIDLTIVAFRFYLSSRLLASIPLQTEKGLKMIVHTHSFCLALFLLVFRYGEANLLQNADFESSNLEDNWECRGGCTMTQSPNAYTGNYSVKVTNRSVSTSFKLTIIFEN